MELSTFLTAVDMHTAGEPFRIVTSGFPTIRGGNMKEKNAFVKKNLEHLRRLVLYEPRGRSTMCGAFLVEPSASEADVGVIFMEPIGLVPMCGHGSIAIGKYLVESGRVKVTEPVTRIKLDTHAGIVELAVSVKDAKAGETTLRNVASFSYMRNVAVSTERFGKIKVDIAYGGSLYAIVSAKDVGLKIFPDEAPKLLEYGEIIRKSILKQVEMKHPEDPSLVEVLYVQFSGPPVNKKADMRNAVIVAPSGIDRSPCGTGTSARMADLFAKGQMKVGDKFIHESIIGTLFRGKIVRETKVGDYQAIVPEIAGSAYITGFQQLVIEDDDPLKESFLLSETP
jgi:proline racemase/trans-L-3-hydroxyproline dehydratase